MGTWKEKLNELVTARWASESKPVFLSQARPLLKRSGLDLPSEAHSVGPKEFLVANASDLFEIVRPTDDPADVVWALAPKGIPRDEIFARYLEEKEKPSDSAQTPRFHKGIWSAFHIPQEDKTERFLNLSGKPSFLNVLAENEAPAGWLHIDSQYLHGDSEEVDRDKTEENLRRWFKDSEIDVNIAVWVPNKEVQSRSQKDFFARMSDLSDRDLSRISVPLDLVVKLLGK